MEMDDAQESSQPETDSLAKKLVSRRLFLGASIGLGGAALSGFTRRSASARGATSPDSSGDPVSGVPFRRTMTEFELPFSDGTHEIVKMPGRPLVLVSQMPSSTLVKIQLNPKTEQVTGVRAFPLGEPSDMLHGLTPSARFRGKIWATHEGGNRLLLVDPGANLGNAPKILRTIDIPGDGMGPHYAIEQGDVLWVTLKTSNQILSINHRDPTDFHLYDCEAHPVFVARHPQSGEFYATQDLASKIVRIDAQAQTTSQIEVPADKGTTPVGLIPGPGGLWVVLLGSMEKGTGTFGRIDGDGEITWFTLTSPEGQRASLLHIGFDPPVDWQAQRAWLLGSSVISPNAVDAIIRVSFDDDYTQLMSEEFAAIPTQLCKAHRVLPLSQSVLATEMTTATVAQLVSARGGRWDRPTSPAPADPGVL